jgi:protein TonB
MSPGKAGPSEPRQEERGEVSLPRVTIPPPGIPVEQAGADEVPSTSPYPLVAGVDATMPILIPGTRVEPVYPEAAKREGVTGKVIMQAIIRKDGTVGNVQVLRAPEPDLGFSEAAVAAVKQWRYLPGQQGDRPVDVIFTILMDFRID